MEVKGILTESLKIENGVSKTNGKEWQKKVIVIKTEDKYPKEIAVEVWNAVLQKMIDDGVKKNDNLTCQINLESREYNGRYYTTATAWKVEVERVTTPTTQPYEDEDDLPF